MLTAQCMGVKGLDGQLNSPPITATLKEKTMEKCEYCKHPLPGGCFGEFTDDDECPLYGEWEETDEDRVGRVIIRNINDRWGFDTGMIDPDIAMEMRRSLGADAIKAVAALSDDGNSGKKLDDG